MPALPQIHGLPVEDHLDVTAYLTDVLRRLPALSPTDIAAIGELLPDCWAKAYPDNVLLSRLDDSLASADQRSQRRAVRRLLAPA